ncbi:MAG: hypothetical protein LBU95_00565 [Rikenellaceae bacterium]|jgi:hypothetical protein|nr:hypothetical protein [Rikenellaceae bacterium]
MKDELKLTPTGEQFPGLDSLRRSAMEGFGGSARDERLIAAAEGDIIAGGSAAGEGAGHPDTGGFERLRLIADTSVTFPGKQALKRTVITPATGTPARRSALRPALIWAASVAAAAMVAFALLVPVLRPTVDEGAALAAGSVPASAAAKSQTREQQGQAQQDTQVTAPEAAVQPTTPTTAVRSGNALAANASHKPVGEVTQSPGDPVPSNENYGLAGGHDLIAQGSSRIVIQVVHDQQPAGTPDVQLSPAAQLLQQLAGATPLERAERPGLERMLSPIDRMAGGSVVAFNRLLGRETTVIKEYNEKGELTHYAVYTPTTAMEKTYKK